MNQIVQEGIELLELWEQNTLSTLEDIFPPETLHQLIESCGKSHVDFSNEMKDRYGVPNGIILSQIVRGLLSVRNLISVAKEEQPQFIPIENVARFGIQAFNTGITIGMALPSLGAHALHQEVIENEEGQRKRTTKARDKRRLQAESAKAKAIEIYQQLIQRRPGLSKDSASIEVQKSLQKNGIKRVVRTVRGYIDDM